MLFYNVGLCRLRLRKKSKVQGLRVGYGSQYRSQIGENRCIFRLGLPTFRCPNPGRGSGASSMASAGARAYNGGLEAPPQRGPGAEPLVRGSGGEAPLKLKTF